MANESTQTPGPESRELLREQRRRSRATNTYKVFLDKLKTLADLPGADLEAAAASVLCALEQRLTADEAFDLESQLPSKLRELLKRCDRHLSAEPRRFGLSEFYDKVATDLGVGRDEAVPLVRAVILAVKYQISQGEADDVHAQLPGDLKQIWQYP